MFGFRLGLPFCHVSYIFCCCCCCNFASSSSVLSFGSFEYIPVFHFNLFIFDYISLYNFLVPLWDITTTRDTWLAQLIECVALDLGIVSLSPALCMEIPFKKSLKAITTTILFVVHLEKNSFFISRIM